jgi:hypothetical protein
MLGKTTEKPTRDGNVKSINDRNARDREPSDLARTTNAGIKRRTRKNRIIGMLTPKLDQEQY